MPQPDLEAYAGTGLTRVPRGAQDVEASAARPDRGRDGGGLDQIAIQLGAEMTPAPIIALDSAERGRAQAAEVARRSNRQIKGRGVLVPA